MIKVLVVIGTRPEAIKLAPVIQELRKQPDDLHVSICVTAQHRYMLDQVLKVFSIQPDYDLDIMEDDQSLARLTARVVLGMDRVLKEVRPDWMLVQGDTTTVLSAALAAYYNGVQVGHVEAGLRTGDKLQPFPEEVNRRLTDALSDLCFAPTALARQHLLSEGIADTAIVVTGNTVIDALLQIAARAINMCEGPLAGLPLDGRRIVLVTAHRRESFGSPLLQVCRALRTLAERYGNSIHIVYPVHRNPNVWVPVHQELGGMPNVTLTEPLDYQMMVALMARAYLILTDSGGIQEEAPSLAKPVLVLRNATERPEGVQAGTAHVVGCDFDAIVTQTSVLLDDPAEYERMARAVNPYGDGRASYRIVKALRQFVERGHIDPALQYSL